ncbi:MAG: dihydroorotase [Eubacteriales bacterium]|nr:dihydroorotase [Eubacteriales bacterium]MDD3883202.1 dihydroorotase [Eubacteriales bacterium]MDD4512722.1 dihydroorotase [Eubacteriales bacterium]
MSETLLKNGFVLSPSDGQNGIADILVKNGKIAAIGANLETDGEVVELNGKHVFPAFVDMHVHLRDPGQTYKEDVESGCRAAAAGGFCAVCCMPNTAPVNDSEAVTKYIIEKANAVGGGVRVYPIGAVSKGLKGEELAEIGTMARGGAVAFSDDGQPVSSSRLMYLAMQYSNHFGKKILSHCEDKALAKEGVMNEGETATRLGLKGIPRAAENAMIAREILLCGELSIPVHICHVSTREGVEMLREAKKRGVMVTAETCPHYIALTDEIIDSRDYDTNARVNPPLRAEADRLAVIEGLRDGTIDVLVTDHAPHHRDDKEVEFIYASSGISGLETAFSVNYTTLCRENGMPLEKLIELMSYSAPAILGLPAPKIAVGENANLAIVNLEKRKKVNAASFRSKGHNTPFDGMEFYGAIERTYAGGRLAFKEDKDA